MERELIFNLMAGLLRKKNEEDLLRVHIIQEMINLYI